MKSILLPLLILITGFSTQAQNKPCSSPEASQFDFWVGTWNLYGADSSLTGTNTVYKILDGCTVQENFESSKIAYSGKSWSMYNAQTKLWQQTWVDNQGGYIVLEGKFENGAMNLITGIVKVNGKEQINRMRYHDIKKDGFEWDWETSLDNGVTWKTSWHLRYERKK
ncbi:MAG: hypothetical protein ABI402_04590 [Ferruginibacter sp.]